MRAKRFVTTRQVPASSVWEPQGAAQTAAVTGGRFGVSSLARAKQRGSSVRTASGCRCQVAEQATVAADDCIGARPARSPGLRRRVTSGASIVALFVQSATLQLARY